MYPKLSCHCLPLCHPCLRGVRDPAIHSRGTEMLHVDCVTEHINLDFLMVCRINCHIMIVPVRGEILTRVWTHVKNNVIYQLMDYEKNNSNHKYKSYS
jgi:hypothetical protein